MEKLIYDFADVADQRHARPQRYAKLALEVTVAAGHNIRKG